MMALSLANKIVPDLSQILGNKAYYSYTVITFDRFNQIHQAPMIAEQIE